MAGLNEIDVGFMEKSPSWKLESRFFPSKVGGKPAWLNLKYLPSIDEIQCNICKKPCIFLIQIYAPFEAKSECFHRTLFIFVCIDPECCFLSDNRNFQVFRCQLPRENDFFPKDPPIEEEFWRPELNASNYQKLCRVCGVFAPHKCSKCKLVFYCSKEHQISDWRNGHKKECLACDNETLSSSKISPLLFPEYELVIEKEILDDGENSEDENSDDDEEDKNSQQEKLDELNKLLKTDIGDPFNENEDIKDLESMAKQEDDIEFTKFRTRIKSMSDQVLRYDRGGIPLYITSSNIPKSDQIPNCPYCNSPRQFEFQILPQILNYFNMDNIGKSIDWGTLIIYTCKQSCDIPTPTYKREFLWKQDILKETETSVNN